jgi:hypothetical protein
MSSLDERLDTLRVSDQPPGDGGANQKDAAAGQEIDLQALAVRVYALLKQELRLERERLGRRLP